MSEAPINRQAEDYFAQDAESSSFIAQRLAFAQPIVRDAAALAMALRPAPGGPAASLKGRQDYVTEADKAVEKLISARIQALYPGDGFIGEEDGSQREGQFTWVVDPIDGTSNFARGRDRWCVSLGLLHEGRPIGGIIFAPALDEFYLGQIGVGAWMNGRPLKASPLTDGKSAMIEMGWSPFVTTEEYARRMSQFLALGAMPRSSGSGALAAADVASGRLDAYLEIAINLWDVAAALVLLSEAGAVTSDFLGEGGATRPTRFLAAAPGLAEALQRATDIPLKSAEPA
ncbi:Inositol-1-monophosphatase [Acetobacteraceae bacterium EV16G]